MIVPFLSDVISVSILVTRVFKPPSAFVARSASAAIFPNAVLAVDTSVVLPRSVADAGKCVSGVHVAEDGTLTIDQEQLAATHINATAINAGDATVAVEGTNVSA